MTTRGEAQELLPNTCYTEHGVHDSWETKVLLGVVVELPLQMGDNSQQLPDCLSRKTPYARAAGPPLYRVPSTPEGSETKLMRVV